MFGLEAVLLFEYELQQKHEHNTQSSTSMQ